MQFPFSECLANTAQKIHLNMAKGLPSHALHTYFLQPVYKLHAITSKVHENKLKSAQLFTFLVSAGPVNKSN